MLHTETVEKGTLDLIKKIMLDGKFKDFNLVGGTALSLQIGHRKSIDIDLFTSTPFNARDLSAYLTSIYGAQKVRHLTNAVFCLVDNIKIDLLSHQYPLVKSVKTIEDVRMVSLEDIGAMKLNAIYGNGTRVKDFIDIYSLLGKFTLDQLFDAFQRKYADINIEIVNRSLTHFEDIDFSMPIMFMGNKISWGDISQRLIKASKNPQMTFGLPEKTKNLLKNMEGINNRKGRRPKM